MKHKNQTYAVSKRNAEQKPLQKQVLTEPMKLKRVSNPSFQENMPTPMILGKRKKKGKKFQEK